MPCPRSVDRGARGWSLPFLTLALGSVLTLSSACRQPTVSAASQPVRLVIGYADTRKYTGTETGIGQIVAILQDEELVRVGRDGRPQADLAERWEQAADGLSWRFHLRPGLRFQDGTPLDATVVATTLRRDLLGSSHIFAGTRDVTDVEAIGPLELVVHLRRTSALLLGALATFAIRSPGDASIGWFRLVSRDANSAKLEAFTGDTRLRSNVDQVEIRLFPSGRNAWSAMMRGQVDLLYEVSPEAWEFIEQSSQAQVKPFLKSYVYMLGLNLRHPVLRSREVRLALNTAVNRDEIIKDVFRGRGKAATGHLWPRHWAYDERLASFHYDPSEAQRLLDTAGVPMKPSTNRRMPSRFHFKCLVPIGDLYERMGLMLQRQLVDAGIDMQLEPIPLPSLQARLLSGKYDAYLYVTAAASLDWTYSFWHSPEPPNPTLLDTGYSGADVMLDQLRVARTDEEIRAAVVNVQRVMRADPPAVFLCWSETARALSARFRLPPPEVVSDRDIIATLPQWQLASPGPGTLLPRQPTTSP